MKTFLVILLTALPCFGGLFTVQRSKAQLVVTVPYPCTEIEVVLTDTKGNVVREFIGGEKSAGKMQLKFDAPESGDYECCVRLDPMSPSAAEIPTCQSIRLTPLKVLQRKPSTPVKKVLQASKQQMTMMRERVQNVTKPPLPK